MEVVVTLVVLVVVAVAVTTASRQRRDRDRAGREAVLQAFVEDLHGRALGASASGPTMPGADADQRGGPTAAPTSDLAARAQAAGYFVSSAEPPPTAEGPVDLVPAASLPTFADVGGMDALKRELRETFGLVLEHADRAAEYGITWNGILFHGPPGVGKSFLARAVAGEFGLTLVHVSTGDLVSSYAGESAKNVERAFEAAREHGPSVLLFDEFDSIAQRRELLAHPEERRTVNQLLQSLEAHRDSGEVIVVATTNHLSDLDPAVVRPGRFDRHIRIDLPDAAARRAIFEEVLRRRPAATREIDLDDLARRAEGLTPAAIAHAVERAALSAFRRAAETGAIVRITHDHLVDALTAHGGADRPTVEDWTWEQLVLPENVVAELRQVEALVADPELALRFGVDPPTGVLLAGPPGTGKTTVAKVLAAQAGCSFYPVSAADVTSKWAGESEQRIRDLFERARANAPSIIFVDEVDAIGAQRGGAGREFADRQLNQLLQEMDGIGGQRGILVVGATNRPDRLDPALTRGGRLSRTIAIPLPDLTARVRLLQLLTRRMPTVAVDLAAIAASTEGLSGADLKAVCQQAALNAMVRARQERDDGLDLPASIHQVDFEEAVAQRRASDGSSVSGGG